MNRSSSEEKSAGLAPRTIAGIALGVVALVFVAQNTSRGRVNFLFWDLDAPAWVWMLILFAAGVVVGSLSPWLRGRRKS